MKICNKIYNTSVKHYKAVLSLLYEDFWYNTALYEFRNSKLKTDKVLWSKELFICMQAYGLTEYDIHKYIGYQKTKAFDKGVGINIAQKLGTNLYQSIKKAVFSNTKIHYRKYEQTNSFEDKTSKSGIIYNENKDIVKIMGINFNLKAIRKNDFYLQEAMNNKIKYCRVIRKPFKNKYKYFLQIVMEGTAPEKLKLGNGYCGLDEGVSTIAYYNDKDSDFVVLANGVEKYEKLIYRANQKYQRRIRLNNLNCYNKDGTIIKGAKFKRTKGSNSALMELKNAYRKKTIFIKQEHNKLSNKIVKECHTLIKEPMNFKALQKRSKVLKRQNKESMIKQKDGTKKIIIKYKRKKRFGKSINRRSPGLFNKIIEDKILKYGGFIIEVNIHKYKASQYNHITKEAIKPSLSERTKQIGKYRVQRDLYSSFLLYNILNEETINFDTSKKLFKEFIEKQEKVIKKIKETGDITNNFGIKDFI